MKTAMYDDRYEAYEDGRLFDKKQEKFLRVNKMNGAVYYRMYIEGKMRMKAIGLVILSAFEKKPTEKHRFVLHRDMNVENIHVSNFVWSTSATWLPDGRRYKIRNPFRTDEDLLRSFRKSWMPGDIKIDGRKYYDCRFTGYKLSKYGDVLSFFSYPPKKLKFGRTGHRHTVTLRVRIEGRFSERKFFVDELLAGAFCPKSDFDDMVTYIDGDPTNLRANNLKWSQSINLFTEFDEDSMEGLVATRNMESRHDMYQEGENQEEDVTAEPEIEKNDIATEVEPEEIVQESFFGRDELKEKLEAEMAEEAKKKKEEESRKKVETEGDFDKEIKKKAKGMKPKFGTPTILGWAKGSSESSKILYQIANAKDETFNQLIQMLGERRYIRGVKIYRLYLLAHEELDLMIELMKLANEFILEKALMQPNKTGRALTDQYIQKWLNE